MNKLKALVLAAAMLVVPAAANAEVAYAAETARLRVGPGSDYPVVAILGRGYAVNVQACLRDYSWCDVIAGTHRGWVSAEKLSYFHDGAYFPVIDYGAAIGIGVVGFIIGNYWQDHYIARPWYRQIPQLRHRPARAAPKPRPPKSAAHARGRQHSRTASRPLVRPATAGFNPGSQNSRLKNEQRPAPGYRPAQRTPDAVVKPRPPQARTRPEGGQATMHGRSQRPRSRQ